jgi:hypothetical protein
MFEYFPAISRMESLDGHECMVWYIFLAIWFGVQRHLSQLVPPEGFEVDRLL